MTEVKHNCVVQTTQYGSLNCLLKM